MNSKFWRVCPLPWLLAAVLLLAIPSGSAVESWPDAQSSPPTTEAFQSLADLLRYISSDWDRLTRSLANCATYPDSKVEGEQTLYLPAGATIPGALDEIRTKCAVRIEHLPAQMREPVAHKNLRNRKTRASLPRTSIRRTRRTIQRNVRLGQLFHHSRFASR